MSNLSDTSSAEYCSVSAQTTLLRLHPSDYQLIEKAAQEQGFSVTEFIELAAYLCAKEIIIYGNRKDFPNNKH